MKKEALVILALLLVLAGCSDNSTGKAIEEIPTTTEVDSLTEKFKDMVTEEELDVAVAIVDDETEETTTTTTQITAPTQETTTTTTEPEIETIDGMEVSIKDNKISPVEVYIKQGETVVWVNNEENIVHMVSSIYSQEFRSDRIPPGETFEHTFNEKGEYQYIDAIFPDKIKGKVIVE